jgi:ketosteroid isomerase-like protein
MKRQTAVSKNGFPAKEPFTTEPETDRRAILDLVACFEEAVKQKDVEKIKTIYLNNDTPVSNRKKNGEVNTIEAGEFAKVLANYKEPISETFHRKVVNVHGNIASLTAIFKWSVNSKEKGTGRVIWLLAKTKDGWKVNHHSWHGM